MRPPLHRRPPLHLPFQLHPILLRHIRPFPSTKQTQTNRLNMSQHPRTDRRSIPSILPLPSTLGDLLNEIP